MTKTQDNQGRPEAEPDLSLIEQETAKAHVDEDPLASNQRDFIGTRNLAIATMCVAYSVFHLLVMNVYPLETWAYRWPSCMAGSTRNATAAHFPPETSCWPSPR